MHPPSPQLLRALRSSIQANSSLSACRASCPARLASPLSFAPRRSNSSSYPARPSRIVPRAQPPKPQTRDRGPRSSETTQTDFAELNVLGNLPTPATAVDACLDDGFHLDNGIKVTGGDGVLLVGGEAFTWRPWQAFSGGADAKSMMVNEKGQFEVAEEVWGLLGLVWPRPDLLILGLGASVFPVSPETKRHINSLGIRVEVQDTRNAAAQFNLLATERGVTDVAAAMIPIGWRGRS
ncbi:hypothetical protein VTN96DRAFT_2155 [Rasamsonia emersonii]|uniref:NADH dehydrogenase [ubiquinone] 1 alpha subcomplex assembly factor 3 n=1 Tax=Rasamsonia emersonii (strain ATCC 16479 / CBS 393.64 / IMI 116815) TaxID=1408163 RepID=A0A0F4YIM1_RASE3|nr:hypothetical protein T310_8080 [Rasamsonia emersonii CBS 393.64]KKA17975.1 hypothetical protein T310_8080 [Rasamsonia emersonii CBS 393.64]